MAPIDFGIVGGGWRSDFYLQIARELPDRFTVSGVVVRDPEKGAAFERRWSVPTFRNHADLLNSTQPLFVVTSVPWATNPGILSDLAERGVPALSETPPAPDLERMLETYKLVERGAKIQVAEQYTFQPHHAARLAIAASGTLGEIRHAQVSLAHGYHGISLMRRFLGIRAENCSVRARAVTTPVLTGPTRTGPPAEEKLKESRQIIAQFDFGDKLGIFDFNNDQYFSWIRSMRLLVRGERGEINNNRIRYLHDHRTPVQYELQRQAAGEEGNLEGFYHKGILAGSDWIYTNPFAPGRLSDDEIAVATCLQKMADYANGGTDFYSLAEASQDHYLNLLMEQSIASGQTIHSDTQPWAAYAGW